MVRLQVARQEAKAQVLADQLLDPPRRGDSQRVGIEPDLEQHLRRIAGPSRLAAALLKRAWQRHPFDQRVDKKDQMVFSKHVDYTRRQQPALIGCV